MKFRRIAAILIMICLISGLFVSCAPAAENAELIDSGNCGALGNGKGVTWTLDSKGVLIISGKGEMRDYFQGWKDHKDKITSVVIEEGVTNIGAAAFRNCRKIGSARIPGSVTSIGPRAFSACTGLYAVSLQDGLTEISDRAFYDCENLQNITIPNSVTSIGEYAFAICTRLTSVKLPENLEIIEAGTFSTCSVLSWLDIPKTVTNIGASAFRDCSKLAVLRMPASVLEIGIAAFENSGLAHLVFEGDAPEFGNDVFYDVEGTAYYHEDNPTWTDENKQSYGGDMSWNIIEPLKIVTQPVDGIAKLGETASVFIEATGNGLSYEWIFKNKDVLKYQWLPVSSSTTYDKQMNAQRNGRTVCCLVHDIHGNVVESNYVTMRLAATVTRQPESVVVGQGETATVSMKAVGDELTYKWYVKKPGATEFIVDEDFVGTSYSAVMSEEMNGAEVYCVALDWHGYSDQTETVTLGMK